MFSVSSPSGSSDRQSFQLGVLGAMAVFGALLVFLWLLTFPLDLEMSTALMTASFFLIGGLSLSFIMAKVTLQPFTATNLMTSILSSVVNIVVIFFVNQLVPLRFDLATVDPRFFGVLIGVAEECFFRLFLCGVFFRMTDNVLLSIGVSSGVWSAYHIARYGGNFNILFIIFLSGCVLGLTFLYTRSADGPIFAHAVVNYIALA